MNGRKRRVPGPDGNLVDATEVGFRAEGEPWAQYLLDDGTMLRLKLVLTEVCRVDDAKSPDGSPIYVFQQTTIHHVSPALRED